MGGCDFIYSSSFSPKDHVIATTWRDGPYLLVVVTQTDKADVKWNLTCKPPSLLIILYTQISEALKCCLQCYFVPVTVTMKGAHGYISVTEWPLMIVSVLVLYFKSNSVTVFVSTGTLHVIFRLFRSC